MKRRPKIPSVSTSALSFNKENPAFERNPFARRSRFPSVFRPGAPQNVAQFLVSTEVETSKARTKTSPVSNPTDFRPFRSLRSPSRAGERLSYGSVVPRRFRFHRRGRSPFPQVSSSDFVRLSCMRSQSGSFRSSTAKIRAISLIFRRYRSYITLALDFDSDSWVVSTPATRDGRSLPQEFFRFHTEIVPFARFALKGAWIRDIMRS